MNVNERIRIFVKFGQNLSGYIASGFPLHFEDAFFQSQITNPWFTQENILLCLKNWSTLLTAENLEKWVEPYKKDIDESSPKKIAVIMAGNIPLVGFHDFLCVLFSGNSFIGKLSSQDKFLLPAICRELETIEPSLKVSINLTEDRISGFEAVIATGSENTSNYFNYYFGKYPHIIRKNRNSVAILTGDETKKDLELLADDVFLYFGLGCRNVTKVYLPQAYNFDMMREAFMKYDSMIMQHNKYVNNYDYHKSIMLINKIPFLDFGLIMLKEEGQFSSPISVLHYEYYNEIADVLQEIDESKEKIQCVVANEKYSGFTIPFGKSQSPELWDYADGMDTLKFLVSLR